MTDTCVWKRWLLCTLSLAVFLAFCALSGYAQNRSPKFDRVQFAIRTGQFELARAAAATATVRSRNGKILKQITLKAAQQAPWKAGTTHYGIYGLKEPLRFCDIRSIEIQFQPPVPATAGPASWTLQVVSVALSIENVNQTALVSAGSKANSSSPPAGVLNASQPLLSFQVPCARQSTLYNRLGGRKAINDVAREFTRLLKEDKRISGNSQPSESPRNRFRNLTNQTANAMCHLSGGPCALKAGLSHSPLAGVLKKPSDFRAVLEDLVGAMQKFPASVSVSDKNELLGTRAIGNGSEVVAKRNGSSSGASLPLDTQAANSGVILNPTFVNLYWDSAWDADNSIARQSVDGAVQAVTASSYFDGLSEYTPGGEIPIHATFFDSYLPHPSCTQRPGATVSFFDPISPSLSGFLNCELQNDDALPQGDNVIYNIIMPQGTIEVDTLQDLTFHQCDGIAPGGWHFHGSPFSVQTDITAFLGGVLGGLVGLIFDRLDFTGAGAIIGFIAAMAMEGSPYWTITSTSPTCSGLDHEPYLVALFHEMIETTVDSTPPLSVLFSFGNGEIADFCDPAQSSNSWNPIATQNPFNLNGTFAFIKVPPYWLNQLQTCITGFADTSMPGLQSISMTGSFPVATITLSGSGFGAAPGDFSVPTSTNMPYLGVQDTTQNWQAGNSLNADPLRLTVTSWMDSAITISGFSPPSGSNFAMQNGDDLVFWICNPKSGLCDSSAATATISGSGQNPNDIVFIGITITTGDDNARADSEIQFQIEDQPRQCLKPSNNASADLVCSNGGSARDQNGRQEWANGTADPNPQTFPVISPAPVFSNLKIQLISHNNSVETDDNWNIQAITITGTTRGGATTTLFSQTNPMPPNSNNCIARLKGSPNATTVTIPLNGVGVPTYADGKLAEKNAATACKNNGD